MVKAKELRDFIGTRSLLEGMPVKLNELDMPVRVRAASGFEMISGDSFGGRPLELAAVEELRRLGYRVLEDVGSAWIVKW